MRPPRSPALACVLAVALLAGCGKGEEGETTTAATPPPKPLDARAQVRATLDTFAAATADRDYRTLCREVLAGELIRRLDRIGLPCETGLRTALEDVESPQLTVGTIRVSGATAVAQVSTAAEGQRPSADVVRLVRERGGWRVRDLAGAGPPTPSG